MQHAGDDYSKCGNFGGMRQNGKGLSGSHVPHQLVTYCSLSSGIMLLPAILMVLFTRTDDNLDESRQLQTAENNTRALEAGTRNENNVSLQRKSSI